MVIIIRFFVSCRSQLLKQEVENIKSFVYNMQHIRRHIATQTIHLNCNNEILCVSTPFVIIKKRVINSISGEITFRHIILNGDVSLSNTGIYITPFRTGASLFVGQYHR